MFFGYYLPAATMVKDEDRPAVPEPVRRITVCNSAHDPAAAMVPVLQGMAPPGRHPGRLRLLPPPARHLGCPAAQPAREPGRRPAPPREPTKAPSSATATFTAPPPRRRCWN